MKFLLHSVRTDLSTFHFQPGIGVYRTKHHHHHHEPHHESQNMTNFHKRMKEESKGNAANNTIQGNFPFPFFFFFFFFLLFFLSLSSVLLAFQMNTCQAPHLEMRPKRFKMATTALFSGFGQTHSTLVACDCERATACSFLWRVWNIHRIGYSAIWLLHKAGAT